MTISAHNISANNCFIDRDFWFQICCIWVSLQVLFSFEEYVTLIIHVIIMIIIIIMTLFKEEAQLDKSNLP